MAAIETTRSGKDARLVGGRLISFFTTVFAALAAWNAARVTRRELSKLSDRELDDIGLSRADIDRL
jgi:uncharacterized protein YjiS (DUF1127 family)